MNYIITCNICSISKDIGDVISGVSGCSGYGDVHDVIVNKIEYTYSGLYNNRMHPWKCDVCNSKIHVCGKCVDSGIKEFVCIGCVRNGNINLILGE